MKTSGFSTVKYDLAITYAFFEWFSRGSDETVEYTQMRVMTRTIEEEWNKAPIIKVKVNRLIKPMRNKHREIKTEKHEST